MYFLNTSGQTTNGGVDMGKKMINRFTNLFKKEGFYVVLFVCLCVVATVSVVVMRNKANVKQKHPVKTQVSENTTKNTKNETRVNYDNALEVKKNTPAKTSNQSNTTAANSQNGSSVATSNSVNTSFTKPVEGVLGRHFTLDPEYWDSTSTYRPNFGIDIKADLGKPVYAVLDGTVEDVETNTDDGVEVTINHQNGLKTKYANLDSNVLVKKGNTIKKGQQIGKVGNTTLRAAYEKYGNHLHFEVLKGDKYVDPSTYVKY